MRYTNAILWEYVADIYELRCAAYHSQDGCVVVDMSHTFFTFACVGTAGAMHTLVADVTMLDIRTFLRANLINKVKLRASLINKVKIKSIGLTKFANGVVEYGSTTFWTMPLSLDAHGRARAARAGLPRVSLATGTMVNVLNRE
jgi:hypothetical protein